MHRCDLTKQGYFETHVSHNDCVAWTTLFLDLHPLWLPRCRPVLSLLVTDTPLRVQEPSVGSMRVLQAHDCIPMCKDLAPH